VFVPLRSTSPDPGGAALRPNLSAVLRVACLSLGACSDAASRTAESGEPMVQVNPQDLRLVAVDSGINEPLDLAVTDDAIWAATHGQVRAVRYRFENPVREEVLHGGGGPEEVREVTTVAPDTSGGVVVWDARTGRVLRIGGDRRIETIRRAEWLQAPLM